MFCPLLQKPITIQPRATIGPSQPNPLSVLWNGFICVDKNWLYSEVYVEEREFEIYAVFRDE